MAAKLEGLIGESVIKKNGDKVLTKSLCGKDRIVGLYFSANWCPPCRGFTPKLADFYTNFKKSEKGENLEIIFVSWDKDVDGFTEYFSSMPWLAIPYSDRDKKAKLTKKYKVGGIPRFVLLDGENGKLITTDGFSQLMEDETGKDFPWRIKPFHEMIKGKLLNGKDELIDSNELIKGKIVGLYFSAHWCPPCRHFTPELIKTYEKLKEEGKSFEVIFISSDRSSESFSQYYSCMPWFAVPFGDNRLQLLTSQYGVDGIPTLVMIDEKGSIITINGRTSILLDRNCSEFPWYPKPLDELTQNAALQLNESVCLVLFTEGEDDEIERAKELLLESATKEHQKGEDQELFFFYGGDDEFCDQVRDFTNLDDQNPLLAILDLPDQQVYVCPEKDITKDIVNNFTENYHNNKLTPRPFKASKTV
ncbi:nucleoredoxin isoform X1 [Patella vulgata]|uniref:nucleoredoxin isoform X1 n=1 Tax=Patella vulgata TaxID=6465 RepID=UPI0021807D9E|nr:nucleoredoxin isoform X1 [Patella vulgata]